MCLLLLGQLRLLSSNLLHCTVVLCLELLQLLQHREEEAHCSTTFDGETKTEVTENATSTAVPQRPSLRATSGSQRPSLRATSGSQRPSLRATSGSQRPSLRATSGSQRPSLRATSGLQRPSLRAHQAHYNHKGAEISTGSGLVRRSESNQQLTFGQKRRGDTQKQRGRRYTHTRT